MNIYDEYQKSIRYKYESRASTQLRLMLRKKGIEK